MTPTEAGAAPGIARRIFSMLYEATLLFAVAFIATWLFQFAAGGAIVTGWQRTALQAYLAAVFAAYFMWCWLRGGQTLAMKAWGIRLVVPGKARVPPAIAIKRLVLAGAFVGAFCAALLGAFMHRNPWIAFITLAISGSGMGWALFDRDRQFLYDRLAGTRLVLAKPE
ncbi:MAG: RDD family protein [Betaproteobacteria bacterium]